MVEKVIIVGAAGRDFHNFNSSTLISNPSSDSRSRICWRSFAGSSSATGIYGKDRLSIRRIAHRAKACPTRVINGRSWTAFLERDNLMNCERDILNPQLIENSRPREEIFIYLGRQ
jgi:hypothetical protein